MGQVRDYEAFIRELLVGVAGGWSYSTLKGWWISKRLNELELARWLREHGAALGADVEVRGQLGCLADLGRGELAEVAGELVRGWEPEVDESEEWLDRGNELDESGKHEEAMASFERELGLKPGDYATCFNRGMMMVMLGRSEEALANFDRALDLKPDDNVAWFNRGVALGDLGRSEEALASYERAIEFKPNYHLAWFNRGLMLDNLGRSEEALASYERVVEFKPDYHDAWFSRGVVLDNFGRSEEAIASFERAIEFKPDLHQAWHGRGVALIRLGRSEEALASDERAIELEPNNYEAWHNRGIAIGILHGYQPEINAYHQAFKHIQPDTHPEGWGYLQHRIGRTHYKEGKNRLFSDRKNPQPYYDRALSSYHNALETLTREEFPKLRLDTLIDTATVHLAQRNTPAARKSQIEALDILRDLLNAESTFEGKKRLQLEYITLSQLDVDLFVASGDNIRAIEAAELDKNNHLIWLLTALEEKTISPRYGQMRQLLGTKSVSTKLNIRGLDGTIKLPLAKNSSTGIIYWHLSPDNLTTFILHTQKPEPQVLTAPSHQLQTWLKTYDSEKLDTADWQELANILQISEINRHLNGIQHLILIPHRDLHRLPLHIYWEQLTTTYLPSIQIGLNLQAKPQPNLAGELLLIESPAYHVATTQTRKDTPLSILPNAEIEAAILEYLFQPKNIIKTGSVSKINLQTKLNQPHVYGHFNGHAYHDLRRPQDSSLILEGDDEFTCTDLAQIDLKPYHLINLSACQTGLTTHQTIDTEYVGLVSAFLSRGTNYVLSTLWSVQDLPSSLLMIVFYMYIKEGNSAPLALREAARWLQNLTYAKEAEFHGKIYQCLVHVEPKSSTARSVDRNRQNAAAKAQEYPEDKPYSSPKSWAAFTVSGWG